MTKAVQLAKLAALANLILDSRLSGLQAAAKAKEECEVQLARLAVPVLGQSELNGVAAELSRLQYQRWADARRADLNQQLARHTVRVIEARDAAREAFGKKQALGSIAAKRPLS